MPKICKIIK